MSGLRITRLVLLDVGVLRGRVDLGSFDPGMTLLTGGNETGKTTVVNALKCAFFEKHGTKKDAVSRLQPHGESVGPEIEVDFQLGAHTYQLRKRFLKRAMSELRVDGGTPLTGAAADERVWELLGAKAPGSGKVKPEQMGLWGVLWVSQDEAAFTDPADRLGDETRGALQEAIGRQVGRIAGGRHGELLRSRVHEEARRYWGAHGKPAGELRAAQENQAEAEARVRTIEGAIHEVEDQALRYASLAARLEELARERPNLQSELEQTERAVATVAQRRRERDEAEQRLAACRAKLEAADVRAREREELVEEIAAASARIDGAQVALAEMERTLAAREDAQQRAAEAQAACEGRVTEADEGRRVAEEAVERARSSREAAQFARTLQSARQLCEEIEALEGERAGALDDAAYERLRELERDRRTQEVALEGEGSRFVVDGGAARITFGRARTLQMEGLGEVALVPGQAGLGAARDRLRDATSAFDGALERHGLSSLEEAAGRRTRRIDLEAERGVLEAEATTRAPEGALVLAEALAADAAALVRDEEILSLVEATGENLAGLRASLEGLKVDAEGLARLEELAQEAEIARAREDAIGTGLEIRALRGVGVRVDDGEAVALGADEGRQWTFTHPTRVTLEDVAEIELLPGGEDVQAAGARRQAAEEALARALAEHGVPDLDGARVQGRVWSETRASIATAEASLRERAPAGLEALREGLRARRSEHGRRTEDLEALAELLERTAALDAELEANAVTAEVLEQLTALEAERADARGAAEAVAARLRLGEEEERLVLERTSGIHGESTWELVPGEGGAELDASVERASLDLAAALERYGLSGLDAATASWRAGLTLGEKLAGLRDRVAAVAPDGIGALERAVEGAAPPEPGAPDEEALAAALETAREAADAGASALAEARDAADEATRQRSDFEAEVAGSRAELQTLREGRDDRLARLETARGEAADDELAAARRVAGESLDAARSEATAAERAVQDAGPELLQSDPERAHACLEENRQRQGDLRAEMSGVKALLDRAAAEGHFEELGEALAEQSEAQRRVGRLERTAAAVRRLAEEVDRAYDAAQARFLAPVVKEAGPYLDAVRPGTEIRMTPDLALDGVVRRGTEEEFDDLSGGTREQLSVIVRIALAKVLARDAQTDPLPLVLDDTMGWTDDARFLQMTRILRNAAKQFQIIVLTCHPERFARLQPGRTIDLEKAKREAVRD